MKFTLTRKNTSDQGTFGVLKGEGVELATAELPWRNNSPRVSCIPAGTYKCRPYSSAKFPNVYEVTSVPGRSAILIHTGNHAGDTSKGLRSNVLGCILVGLSTGLLNGQMAVKSSKAAMDLLRSTVGKSSFDLVVVEAMEGDRG